MGIAVQELLANDFFKDYEVIAGHKGLNKEIQGITVLEAPDGFKWTKGKEMVLSSGYAISRDPGCIANAFAEGTIQKISALMIKTGRYLDKIPEDLVDMCNKYDLPLIAAPFSAPWMDIISQTNVSVMNKTIRTFQVPAPESARITNQSFKEQKIRKILQSVENEMKFPALLHDFLEDKSYYSSSKFERLTDRYEMKESDYWNPSMAHTRHMLCDYTKMTRYRRIGYENSDGVPVSWVTIPIKLGNTVRACFAVMESHDLLDYYDEFAIRIAYLMLQSLYEQIGGAKDAGYIGFENFIHFAMSCAADDSEKIISQASIQGISMSDLYDHVIIRLKNKETNSLRKKLMSIFSVTKCSHDGKLVILDDRDMLLLLDKPENNEKRSAEEMKGMVTEYTAKVKEEIPNLSLKIAACHNGKTLLYTKQCVDKCHRVLDMGELMFPDREYVDYDMLGPLTWLDIPEDELNRMLASFSKINKDEKGRDLLLTLRVYLENNMNYSITADIMYVHINTIRKRIDKVCDLLGTDFSDPMERIRMILLLQYI